MLWSQVWLVLARNPSNESKQKGVLTGIKGECHSSWPQFLTNGVGCDVKAQGDIARQEQWSWPSQAYEKIKKQSKDGAPSPLNKTKQKTTGPQAQGLAARTLGPCWIRDLSLLYQMFLLVGNKIKLVPLSKNKLKLIPQMASPVMATAWKVIQNLLNKHSLSFLVFLNPGKAKSYSIAS